MRGATGVPEQFDDGLSHAGIAAPGDLYQTARWYRFRASGHTLPAAAASTDAARGDDRPLLGVPVAVKDSVAVAVAGHAASMGTRSPQPTATADAEVVRRLRTAGVVVLVSTRVHAGEVAAVYGRGRGWPGPARRRGVAGAVAAAGPGAGAAVGPAGRGGDRRPGAFRPLVRPGTPRSGCLPRDNVYEPTGLYRTGTAETPAPWSVLGNLADW